MENKKLGVLLVILALLIGGIVLYYNNKLSNQAVQEGCFEGANCVPIEKGLSINHFAIGVFSFILALGFYLLFFNKTDEKILKKLEDDKHAKIQEEKLNYVLMALDPYEKKVLLAIKDQNGITQSTLRLKLDMSKAKLSYVLQELEKRNLIKRLLKGKTLQLFLRV